VVGFGAKPFRTWVKSDIAKEFNPTLYDLLNATVREITGAQMNKEEVPRIEAALGLRARSTVAEFLKALQNRADNVWNHLLLQEQALAPESLSDIQKRGIFTSRDIPKSSGIVPIGEGIEFEVGGAETGSDSLDAILFGGGNQ